MAINYDKAAEKIIYFIEVYEIFREKSYFVRHSKNYTINHQKNVRL